MSRDQNQGLRIETAVGRRLDAGVVDYLEAHGTGTSLGDPIEVGALASVLGHGRDSDHELAMGAVKANIGHLECAAGIAGVIKAVLVLQHERVPPVCWLQTLNPKIGSVVGGFPVHFPQKAGRSLPRCSGVTAGLTVGVSSFGYAGTIAHAVLAQVPRESQRSPSALKCEDAARSLSWLAASLPKARDRRLYR